MKGRWAGLIALLMLGSVTQAEAALFDPAYRVVFPAGRAKILLSPSCAPLPAKLLPSVSGTWTPSNDDIDALEDHLPEALKIAVGKISGIGPETVAVLRKPESIANHARQYAGIMLGRHKRILVIAAPIRYVGTNGPYTDFQVQNSSWRGKHALGACDGDLNQFSAQYDPVTGSFDTFMFSGAAGGKSTP
ncbi:MAG: hypothetical protein V4559_15120 [Pseudomonadota bacterium]